jgi:polysaccharide deacetylase 2 family uncharacterized protein YibQ
MLDLEILSSIKNAEKVSNHLKSAFIKEIFTITLLIKNLKNINNHFKNYR